MTIEILHRRADGSLVVQRGGLPYHVTPDDPIFAEAAAAAEGLDLPPEAVPAPPSPVRAEIAKTAIYRRATDAEIETFLAFLTGGATARQRLMWEDAAGGVVLVDDVQPLAEALFGPARAAELLAP